jgi:putative SOS response-associated peptidase YedK
MPNNYGYTERQWEIGKRDVREILRLRASQERTISYGELSSKLTSIRNWTSRACREAMKRRRCLVPANWFYEWQKIDAKTKQL